MAAGADPAGSVSAACSSCGCSAGSLYMAIECHRNPPAVPRIGDQRRTAAMFRFTRFSCPASTRSQVRAKLPGRRSTPPAASNAFISLPRYGRRTGLPVGQSPRISPHQLPGPRNRHARSHQPAVVVDLLQHGLDGGVGKGVPFHADTLHAPVGVKVEHGTACPLAACGFRHRPGQVIHGLHLRRNSTCS